jgi:hypothetical protein
MNVTPAAVALENHYLIECFAPDGTLKWVDEIKNLVVTEGLNDLLTKYLKGSSYTAAWFVGLISGTPTVEAGHTLASHTGWTEITDYTGNRKGLTLGTASAGSIDNSASKAVFAILDTATVGGAFVGTAETGTSGILYGAGAFTGGNKAVGNGDTLNVTVTLTAAAA